MSAAKEPEATAPAPAAAAAATTWTLDPAHATLGFSVRHMLISTVKGRFTRARATVCLDESSPGSATVEAVIEASSIDTGDPMRDEFLRSAELFAAQAHPTLRFSSTRVERHPKGGLTLHGELTIRTVTCPLSLRVEPLAPPVNAPGGRRVRRVCASGKLSRRALGLSFGTALETGGVVVGDEVKLQIDAELVAAQPR